MLDRIPPYLEKYLSQQNYSSYTTEDQAVWRYIMRQLKYNLRKVVHPSYEEGLKKTGIDSESIPRISQIDEKLQEFGWRAVTISGFIPPSIFMELQSLQVLPIACELRSIEHIPYTPAPDIVHEAAGHAPILIDPEFSSYLKNYAKLARKAIFSDKDLDVYDKIRQLSDTKENPQSTQKEIDQAQEELNQSEKAMTYISEASQLARMNWWTVEYGLMGDLKNPKIFGAGLLSSIGESRACLSDKVKRIPLSLDCIHQKYDITEYQPQLFVASNFQQLTKILKEFSVNMAFQQGGLEGLKKALDSKTVNTIELDSGLQISGKLKSFSENKYLQFEEACQLSYKDQELDKQGVEFHKEGYGTPIGDFKSSASLEEGKTLQLNFNSGVKVKGYLKKLTKKDGKNILASFTQCLVVDEKNQTLFDPSWGVFDMAFGTSILSVFGGASDRKNFLKSTDFSSHKIKTKKTVKKVYSHYEKIRSFRTQSQESKAFNELIDEHREFFIEEWLPGVELLELAQKRKDKKNISILKESLITLKEKKPHLSELIDDGIQLA